VHSHFDFDGHDIFNVDRSPLNDKFDRISKICAFVFWRKGI
jgi:hypothetical protein